MPRYNVEWSLKGNAIVEAEDWEEAKQKVLDLPEDALYADVDGIDVSDVAPEEESDA
jgi:hypothetical protein